MAIVIGAEITTDPRELDRDMRRDSRIIERRLGGAFRSVGRIAAASFRGIGIAARTLGRALLAPLRILTSIQGLIGVGLGGLGVDRLIRNAGALELRTKALANQLEITERNAGRLISRINAASAGVLDFARASELANQAGILDIPADRLERLVRVFTLLSVARGRTDNVSADIEELLNSIARGEPPRRFGIFVGPEEFRGLDLAGRQALTLRRSLEELEARAARLGLTGNELLLTYTGIFGNIKDIVGEVGRWLLQIDDVEGAIRGISELTGNILQGLQGGQGGDIARALLVSLVELGPALVQTLGNIVEKGFKLGIATLLETAGSIDFSELGRAFVASIGQAISELAPRLAGLLGIDSAALAAAQASGGNVLQRGAAGLRASAAGVDTFGPLRRFGGNVASRFAPTQEARGGDLTGLGLASVDLGRLTPGDISAARSRLAAPFRERFNRIFNALLEDPEIAGRIAEDPSSRTAVRQRAQIVARAELQADRALASLGSPGQRERIRQAQRDIAQSPANADLRRQALQEQLLAGLTQQQRENLLTFNRRTSVSPAQFDPLGRTRRQLGAGEDAGLLELLGRAAFGGGRSSADEIKQQQDRQKEAADQAVESMSQATDSLIDLSGLIERFANEIRS